MKAWADEAGLPDPPAPGLWVWEGTASWSDALGEYGSPDPTGGEWVRKGTYRPVTPGEVVALQAGTLNAGEGWAR